MHGNELLGSDFQAFAGLQSRVPGSLERLAPEQPFFERAFRSDVRSDDSMVEIAASLYFVCQQVREMKAGLEDAPRCSHRTTPLCSYYELKQFDPVVE